MRILLTDLLPSIYNQIVREFTHNELSPSARWEILLTLMDNIRWAALVGARKKDTDTKFVTSYVYPSFTAGTLITNDRLSSKWASREEIVEQIKKSTGLSKRIAHISLLLIEATMDIALSTGNTITVENLGKLYPYPEEKYATVDSKNGVSDISHWYERTCSHVLEGITSPCDSILSRWFKRHSHYLTIFVEHLELSVTSRKPVAYQIDFFPEILYQKSSDLTMIWKEAFPANKLKQYFESY